MLTIGQYVSEYEMYDLLSLLWNDQYELTFHDNVYPTISDPGAYFSYSTKKSASDEHWSMTYGNHGWSGGIYHITSRTLSKQITSLIKKNELNSIQLSGVVFLSHYDTKTKEESLQKDAEIRQMHSRMTREEIINRITSKDPHQIWESSCEIISLGQDKKAIKPLIL